MCGRYASSTERDVIATYFSVDETLAEELPPSWNVAPTDEVYCVAQREGRRRLRAVRWGLVPSWAKDKSGAARHINARAETVADRRAFARAFERRRCLVPADGFYEWRRDQTGKTPFYIRRRDRAPMAFAGLWEFWRNPGDADESLRTCAIITTDANGVIRPLHDRMPVILEKDMWDDWLGADADPAFLRSLLVPPDDGLVEAYAVASFVGDVRNNGPELVAPV